MMGEEQNREKWPNKVGRRKKMAGSREGGERETLGVGRTGWTHMGKQFCRIFKVETRENWLKK